MLRAMTGLGLIFVFVMGALAIPQVQTLTQEGNDVGGTIGALFDNLSNGFLFLIVAIFILSVFGAMSSAWRR